MRSMGLDHFSDSILGLLKSAGVKDSEVSEKKTREKIVGAYLKGRDFAEVAEAVLKEHGVEVVEGA